MSITRTIRFTNTQWFGMMENTIYDINSSISSITRVDRLLTFIGLKCWLTILALQRLSLLPIVKQTGLLTVDGLASLLILLALQTFLFTWITRKYSLNRSILIQTFYISTNNRQNKVTSRSDMVTTVYRFRSSLTNIVQ